jgi:hypothetical protein
MMEMVAQYGHEKVVFCHDKESGLKAIIGIHSTVLGPAIGGCRMKKYGSTKDALFDVLRLSKGMSYKCAAAELGMGGGKSVIIADPKTEKTEELLKAFARAVDSLGGLYISAEDMGMSVDDINLMKTVSPYIVGCSKEYSGNGTNDRSNPASLWAKRSTALYSEGYAIFKAWCTTQRIEGTQNKTGKYHHNYSLVEIQLACRRQHRLPQNKTLNNDNR